MACKRSAVRSRLAPPVFQREQVGPGGPMSGPVLRNHPCVSIVESPVFRGRDSKGSSVGLVLEAADSAALGPTRIDARTKEVTCLAASPSSAPARPHRSLRSLVAETP
jgi:hypothetical protein